VPDHFLLIRVEAGERKPRSFLGIINLFRLLLALSFRFP
jgi:hypothetical protein